MRNIIRSVVLVLVAISFTSCIELVEEMKIKDDTSGTWELRLEAMGLQSLLGSIGKYLNDDMVSSWKSIPNDKIKTLEEIKGISNVEASKSGDFVIGLKFDFDNHRALNKALYALLGAKKKFFYPKLYKVRN